MHQCACCFEAEASHPKHTRRALQQYSARMQYFFACMQPGEASACAQAAQEAKCGVRMAFGIDAPHPRLPSRRRQPLLLSSESPTLGDVYRSTNYNIQRKSSTAVYMTFSVSSICAFLYSARLHSSVIDETLLGLHYMQSAISGIVDDTSGILKLALMTSEDFDGRLHTYAIGIKLALGPNLRVCTSLAWSW